MHDIVNWFMLILSLLFWALIIIRFVGDRFAPVKTVKAQVCDKYKPQHISRYPSNIGTPTYIVVFKTENKTLSFRISEYSYGGYKIGERGTLKYKGRRLISFR